VDAIKNPYTPNAGARPPELAGRNPQIESFRILVGRLKAGATEKSLIITGLRGVGKTVLLNAFEDMAEAEGFRTSFRELDSSSSISELLARDVQKTLLQLSLAKFELGVDLRKIGNASMLADDMTEIFLALGDALVSKGEGFILFLDELQFIKEHEFRALISALHRVNQKSLPISLAAAGLPNIPQVAGEARSYAERLFDFPTIGKLEPPDAQAALVEPAKQRGAQYELDALARALELTEGYPFYLQEFGKHIWNLAPASPIRLADVDAATPIAVAALAARGVEPGEHVAMLMYNRLEFVEAFLGIQRLRAAPRRPGTYRRAALCGRCAGRALFPRSAHRSEAARLGRP